MRPFLLANSLRAASRPPPCWRLLPMRTLMTTPSHRSRNSTPPSPLPEQQGPPTSSESTIQLEPHPASPDSQHAVPPPPPPPPPPKTPKKKTNRRLLSAALFLLIGAYTGRLLTELVLPTAAPLPDSPDDTILLAAIRQRAEALPIVRTLSADTARYTSWDAYAGFNNPTTTTTTAPARRPSVTSGAMRGARGLGYQRIFHDAATGEVVSVVWLGRALSGFPGIAHGGALATLLDESMGRCAILRFPARTAVTATLRLDYRRTARAGDFCVVRVAPLIVDPADDAVVGPDGVRKSDRKLWVTGTVEREDGTVLVEAKGLFVVPKGAKPTPMAEQF